VQELGRLDFLPLDPERFPAPGLARRAAAAGSPYPAVLNAANEEAVAAFLRGEIGFPAIVRAVDSALGAYKGAGSSLEQVMEADRWAREYFKQFAGKVST